MRTQFAELITTLADAQVEFVVLGGVAVNAHGHVRGTEDLDICYARGRDNLARLAAALAPFGFWLRGGGRELPFVVDEKTLRSGLNFTLRSDRLGDLDLLGEVAGLGQYEQIAPTAVELILYGRTVRVVSLDQLERSKQAAGRPKDLIDLEAIRAIRTRRPPR